MKQPQTKALLSALVSTLLCGATVQAQAFTITTTESRYEPAGLRYYFEVNNWTPGDQGENPCFTTNRELSTCNITVEARMPGSSTPVESYERRWAIPVNRSPSSTLGSVLVALMKQGFQIPLNGSMLVPLRSADNNICIGFYTAVTGPAIGAAHNLFGPCTPVAMPTMQCEITGDATIDYKRLPDDALNGVKASTQLDLQCRGPASVTVSASKTDALGVRLRSDGSLYSKITVNGKDATEGINVAVSNGRSTKLNITSTLSPQGVVAPGEFSGFTVITVAPP